MRTSLLMPWLVAFAGACKPADEPPRHATPPARIAAVGPALGPPPEPLARAAPDAAPPPIDERVRVTEADLEAGPERAAPDAAPDATSSLDAEAPPVDTATVEEAIVAEPEVAGPEVGPTGPPLEDARWSALVVELDRTPSAEQQEQARALNKSGLEKHRKSKWEEAIADYRAALAAWPAHPFSRYNLACALALRKQPEDALLMLRALERVARTDTAAADRLRAARIDSDFVSLRTDPRFRELTGATDILVAWSREDERALAKRHVEALKNARWSARAAPRAWNALDELPRTPTVLHRADDAVAARVVADVARALEATSPGIAVAVAGPLPPEAPPIVVWLPPPGPIDAPPPLEQPPDAPPDAPPDPAPDAGTSPRPVVDPAAPDRPAPAAESLTVIKDFIGHRLVPDGASAESLELKPTGFFVWVIGPARPGDGTTTRTGRYQLRGPSLTLTFKETLETPTQDGAPRIEVHEGRTLTLLLTVPEPGTLTIEARPFHVR